MSWLELSNLPLLEAIGVLGGGGAPFNKDTVANLAHWIKADDLATLFQDSAKTTPIASDGDPVGAWVDQIAAEYIQATTGAKPTYRASVAAFGNRAALQFYGDDWLQGAFAGALTQPNTIFVVGQIALTTNEVLIDGDDTLNRHLFMRASGAWTIRAGINLPGSAANTNVNVGIVQFNGASSVAYVNGTSVVSGDAGNQSMDGMTIGASYAATAPLTGYIAEILIYNAALATADLNTVQNYLAAKYSISVTEFS